MKSKLNTKVYFALFIILALALLHQHGGGLTGFAASAVDPVLEVAPIEETIEGSIPSTSGSSTIVEETVPIEENYFGTLGGKESDPQVTIQSHACVNLTDPSTYGFDVVNVSGTYYLNNDTSLCQGNYNLETSSELIVINASNIELNCNSSTLIGNGSGSAIYANNSAQNVTIFDCGVVNYEFGFNSDFTNQDPDNWTIYDNTFTNLTSRGVSVLFVSNTLENILTDWNISANTFDNVSTGVYLYVGANSNTQEINDLVIGNNIFNNSESYPIYFLARTDEGNAIIDQNTIRNNHFVNGGDFGVVLRTLTSANSIGPTAAIGFNVIDNNTFENISGIYFLHSQSAGTHDKYIGQMNNNVISNNSFSNGGKGLYHAVTPFGVSETCGAPANRYCRLQNNVFTLNSFVNMTVDVELNFTSDSQVAITGNSFYDNLFTGIVVDNYAGNKWNTTQQTGPNIAGGSDIGGNSYDDYIGFDIDGDGIGESSYSIAGLAGNVDYLPAITNYGGCVDLSNSSTFENKIVNFSNSYYINTSIALCSGTYTQINDTYLIVINESNIELNCNDATLIGTTGTGIYSNTFDNLTIHGCNFENFSTRGMDILGTSGSLIYENTGTSSAGIRVTGSNSILTNNTLVDTDSLGGSTGFVVSGSGMNVTNNIANNLTGPGVFGLYILGSGNLVNNNNFTNNNEGMFIQSLSSTTISNNLFSGESVGIRSVGVGTNTIIDNTFSSLTANAIFMETGNDGLRIINNSIQNIGQLAINVRASNNTYISGNTFNQTISHILGQVGSVNITSFNNIYYGAPKVNLQGTHNSSFTNDKFLNRLGTTAAIVAVELEGLTLTNVTIEDSLHHLSAVNSSEISIVNSVLTNATLGLNATNSNLTIASTVLENGFEGINSTFDFINLTLSDPLGTINFPSVNLTADVMSLEVIFFGSNLIGVDSVSALELNESATITLTSTPGAKDLYLYDENGNTCQDCVFVSRSGTNATFTVDHFTNYSSGINANLTIYDQNDTGSPANVDDQIKFYSNYSSIVPNVAINDSLFFNGSCNIEFNVTGANGSMAFNGTSQLYEFNRTFSTGETVGWNVSCNSTNYDTLNVSDLINITEGYVGCVNLTNPSTYQNKVVNVSGTFFVNDELTLCTAEYRFNSTALTINMSNIVVEGNSSTLVGNLSLNNRGINTGNKPNLTISNFNVQNFSFGIYVETLASNVTLQNNNVTFASNTGLFFAGSNGFSTNNFINGSAGIEVHGNNTFLIGDTGIGNTSEGIVIFGNHNTLTNVTGFSNDEEGVALNGDFNKAINANSTSTSGFACSNEVSSSNNNNFTGGNCTSTGGVVGFINFGINHWVQDLQVSAPVGAAMVDLSVVPGSSNNTFINNTFTGAQAGALGSVALAGSGVNEDNFIYNTFIGSAAGIVFSETSHDNNFINNTFISGGPIIEFNTSSDNNTFTGNIFNGSSHWVMFLGGTNNNNSFEASTFLTPTTAVYFNSSFTVPNGSHISNINFNLSFNNTYLNSTDLPFMNTTAQITLFGLENNTLENILPLVDYNDNGVFEECVDCVGVSFTNGTGEYVFNVSHFTTYAGGTDPTFDCSVLDSDNTVYNMTRDVGNVSGTCFDIAAVNVTLDCKGYSIINVTTAVESDNGGLDEENTIIRNCNFIDTDFAINVRGTNLLIENINVSGLSNGDKEKSMVEIRFNNGTIRDSNFENINLSAIKFVGENAVADNVRVTNFSADLQTDFRYYTQIEMQGLNGTVKNSVFDASGQSTRTIAFYVFNTGQNIINNTVVGNDLNSEGVRVIYGNLTVFNNEFENIPSAIKVFFGSMANSTISNNLFNNSGYVLDTDPIIGSVIGTNIYFMDNQIYSDVSSGFKTLTPLRITKVQNVIVDNNTIVGYTSKILDVDGVINLNLTSNVFSTTATIMDVSNSSGVLIDSSNFTGDVLILNAFNLSGTFSNNLVENNSLFAFNLTNSTAVFENNTFDDVSGESLTESGGNISYGEPKLNWNGTDYISSYSPITFNGVNYTTKFRYLRFGGPPLEITQDNLKVNLSNATLTAPNGTDYFNLFLGKINSSGIDEPDSTWIIYGPGSEGFSSCAVWEAALPGTECALYVTSAFTGNGVGTNYTWNLALNSTFKEAFVNITSSQIFEVSKSSLYYGGVNYSDNVFYLEATGGIPNSYNITNDPLELSWIDGVTNFDVMVGYINETGFGPFQNNTYYYESTSLPPGDDCAFIEIGAPGSDCVYFQENVLIARGELSNYKPDFNFNSTWNVTEGSLSIPSITVDVIGDFKASNTRFTFNGTNYDASLKYLTEPTPGSLSLVPVDDSIITGVTGENDLFLMLGWIDQGGLPENTSYFIESSLLPFTVNSCADLVPVLTAPGEYCDLVVPYALIPEGVNYNFTVNITTNATFNITSGYTDPMYLRFDVDESALNNTEFLGSGEVEVMVNGTSQITGILPLVVNTNSVINWTSSGILANTIINSLADPVIDLTNKVNLNYTRTTNYGINLTITSNSTGIFIVTSKNNITWSNGTLDSTGYFGIVSGDGFVSINSSHLPGLNTTATVDMGGIDCSDFSLHYAPGFATNKTTILSANGVFVATELNNGSNCNDPSICTNVLCENNVLSFEAQHFSGFAEGINANLTIFDGVEGGVGAVGSQINFFANYTKADLTPITNSTLDSGLCQIEFNSTPFGPFNMTFNTTGSDEWVYNRSFSSQGTHLWNVTCTATSFDTLNSSDDLQIIDCVDLNDPGTFGSKIVNTSGSFYINENVTLCTDTYYFNSTILEPAIIFNDSNIKLDCSDSSLIGNQTGMGLRAELVNGIDIYNCDVAKYTAAAYLLDVNDVKVINNTFSGFAGIISGLPIVTGGGFVVNGGSNYLIEYNSFNGTDNPGLLNTANNTIIRYNYALSNSSGAAVAGRNVSIYGNNLTSINSVDQAALSVGSYGETVIYENNLNGSRAGLLTISGFSGGLLFENNSVQASLIATWIASDNAIISKNNLTAAFGALFQGGSINNNTFIYNNMSTILVAQSTDNRFINNTVNGATGISLQFGAQNNNFTGNNLTATTTGIFINAQSNNNRFENNYVLSSPTLTNSTGNEFISNTFVDTILLTDVSNYNFSNNLIYQGIQFNGSTSNNSFINSNISQLGTWFNLIGSGENNNLTNTLFVHDNATALFSGTFELNNGTYSVTTSEFNLSYNNTFVNSTALPFMNTSAQLTFFGINATNINEIGPVVDLEDDSTFITCADCVEISYNTTTNTYVYNVSHFTSYAVGAQSNACVTPVDDLVITTDTTLCNGTYNLADAGSSGVIIIGASDVTVNCDQTILNGPGTGSAFAFDTSATRSNINIEDCTIQNYENGLSTGDIGFNLNNLTLENNTFFNNTRGTYFYANHDDDDAQSVDTVFEGMNIIDNSFINQTSDIQVFARSFHQSSLGSGDHESRIRELNFSDNSFEGSQNGIFLYAFSRHSTSSSCTRVNSFIQDFDIVNNTFIDVDKAINIFDYSSAKFGCTTGSYIRNSQIDSNSFESSNYSIYFRTSESTSDGFDETINLNNLNLTNNADSNSNYFYYYEDLVASGDGPNHNVFDLTFVNNTVQNNSYGIIWNTSTTTTDIYNNIHYNNLLNTTILSAYDQDSNDWNTTNQTGPNIIGGANIGGNFYSDYSGYDIDNDGIGEFEFNISGNVTTDYLPITNEPFVNTAPVINSVILNSTLGTNLTSENLTIHINVTDVDNHSIINIADWRKWNGTAFESIAIVNLPFEPGNSNATFAKDYSTNGIVGSVSAAVFSSTGSQIGRGAYQFNSSIYDYISLPSLFTDYLLSDFNYSVSFNVYPTAQGRLYSKTGDNNWASYIFLGNDLNYNVGATTLNAGTIGMNQWHSIVLSENGSNMSVYVDGVSLIEGTLGTHPTGGSVLIGDWYTPSIFGFGGLISDFTIFKDSLSEEQIVALSQNKSELIVSQETSEGDIWQVCVTPNDGTTDGETVCSNNITILPGPQMSITLNSPANDSSSSSSSATANINFDWSIINNTQNATCNLTLDGSVVDTLNLTINGTNSSTQTVGAGTHYWNVTCAAQNVVTSKTRQFTYAQTTGGGGGGGGGSQGGCTDTAATNYESWADYNDGSCVYAVSGCTDSSASNYNPSATIDDGSCIASCNPNWDCLDWSSCSGGRQTRSCSDLNSCGTATGMPSGSRSCTEEKKDDDDKKNDLDLDLCIEVKGGESPKLIIGEIDRSLLPNGSSPIISPMKLACQPGESVTLDLALPSNYVDIGFIECLNGICSPRIKKQITELKCGDKIVSSQRESKIYSPEVYSYTVEEQNQTLISGASFIDASGVQISFIGENNMNLVIGTPKTAIPQAANPSLSIVGSPLEITIDSTKLSPLEITLPFIGVTNEVSLNAYALVNNDPIEWKYVGGVIDHDKKTVSFTLEDGRDLAIGNKLTLALMEVICANCDVAQLKLVHSPQGARDAVILVHGLASNADTFTDIVNDIRSTGQPWQAYTYGYSSADELDLLAKDLAFQLQLNSDDYDRLFFAAHSLGGVLTQLALDYAYTEHQLDSSKFTFIEKVQKVIMVGTPNKGSPGAQLFTDYYSLVANLADSSHPVISANPKTVQMLIEGIDVNRVPGVEYFAIAGTKPFDLDLGIFKRTIDLFSGASNDGLVSAQSARTIGGEEVNNQCSNYWELDQSHLALLQNDVSRQVIERIIAGEIEKGIQTQQYFSFTIDSCNPNSIYVVHGIEIDPLAAADPTGCSCGNGVCGIDETAVSCPSDCLRIAGRTVIGLSSLIYLILFILLLVVLLGALYYHEREDIKMFLLNRKLSKNPKLEKDIDFELKETWADVKKENKLVRLGKSFLSKVNGVGVAIKTKMKLLVRAPNFMRTKMNLPKTANRIEKLNSDISKLEEEIKKLER